jgi:hypothetical protein
MPPRLSAEEAVRRVQVSAPISWFEQVDDWRRQQHGRLPTQAEAIRELVNLGLRSTKTARS